MNFWCSIGWHTWRHRYYEWVDRATGRWEKRKGEIVPITVPVFVEHRTCCMCGLLGVRDTADYWGW